MTPEEINKLKDQYIKDLSAFVDYKLESEKELVQAKAIRDAEIHGLKQEIDSLKAELEQHRWIPISERNPNKKDCNKKGMVETWDDVYQCSKMAGIENILSQPVRFTHFRKQLLPSPPKP